MRGRWADGIVPKGLIWVLKDRFAICERPGGFGPNHRAVRRTEEIIWIRRNDFGCIVSLLPGPHNLHSYDEHEMPYVHMPLSEAPPPGELLAVYEMLTARMAAGERLLVHHERVDDALGAMLAGYLLWTGRVTEVPAALAAVERLLRRPMGRLGRETVVAFARSGLRRPDTPPPDTSDATTPAPDTPDGAASGPEAPDNTADPDAG